MFSGLILRFLHLMKKCCILKFNSRNYSPNIIQEFMNLFGLSHSKFLFFRKISRTDRLSSRDHFRFDFWSTVFWFRCVDGNGKRPSMELWFSNWNLVRLPEIILSRLCGQKSPNPKRRLDTQFGLYVRWLHLPSERKIWSNISNSLTKRH